MAAVVASKVRKQRAIHENKDLDHTDDRLKKHMRKVSLAHLSVGLFIYEVSL